VAVVEKPITNVPRYHAYFLALIVVSFPIGAALVHKAVYPEWRQVQGAYIEAARNRGVNLQPPGVQPFTKKLRQILVESKTIPGTSSCHTRRTASGAPSVTAGAGAPRPTSWRRTCRKNISTIR
jgi:hypothetical protein